VVTVLVILLYKPFSFAAFSFAELISWALFFGFIVALMVLLVVKFLQKGFLNFMQEENRTIGKEITLVFGVITCILTAFFILFYLQNPEVNPLLLFKEIFVRTSFISIFPVLTLVLYEQYYHQKMKSQEAQSLNLELANHHEQMKASFNSSLQKEAKEEKLTLRAENEKVALSIDPQSLLYVKSDANYVEVFYLNNQKIKKELIRIQLKSIEEQIPQTNFFRCHKRYLVNLKHIIKVKGNARNLVLVLDYCNEEIPVSRSKSEKLQELIQSI